jgi:hypothetical protein
MQAFLSPGSLVTVAGAVLTVIGSIAYLGDNANLSLPTIFYGIPILLGGLALKSSELPPPQRLTPPNSLRELRQNPDNAPLSRLLADVTRWQDRQDRLGRFFGPGLAASVTQPAPGQVLLVLQSAASSPPEPVVPSPPASPQP